jgi:enoyl-[acyl-carrier-protein] reductase (NADH)
VNAIAPGSMDTQQNIESMGADTTFVSRDRVADVALFLISEAAAGITGETIQVLGETIR